MNPNEAPVTLNRADNRFELEIDHKLSFVAYVPENDTTLALTHTEVDPDLEGKGVGARLVKGVFEYLDQHNLKMVPLCPFIAVYVKRHPEWQRLVAESSVQP